MTASAPVPASASKTASTPTGPAIVLTGPTGSGKTAGALRLAERLPVEIVSVDSALVYRGLDIGTAKPSLAERAQVPHHLIDICDPAESYSAGRFVEDAVRLVADIQSRGRTPLLIGGTLLYLRALWRGIAPMPTASPELRKSIDERAAREGWRQLHAELARLDPEAASSHSSERSPTHPACTRGLLHSRSADYRAATCFAQSSR